MDKHFSIRKINSRMVQFSTNKWWN